MAINTFPVNSGLEEVQYNFISNCFCYSGSQDFKFSLRLFIDNKVIRKRKNPLFPVLWILFLTWAQDPENFRVIVNTLYSLSIVS